MSRVTALVPRYAMTPPQARALTDRIRADAEALWSRLLDAYERGVHTALGYESWHAYMKVEFGKGRSAAYQLLSAGRVARAIEAHSADADSIALKSENVARALAPVLRQKGAEAVAEAHAEAVVEHGPEPTAEQVRQIAQQRLAPVAQQKLTREQQHFSNNLSGMAIAAGYVSRKLRRKTKAQAALTAEIMAVDEKTWAEWREQANEVYNAARQLRRIMKEGEHGNA